LKVVEEGIEKTYVKNLNAEEMTLLIKDKFMNWKDLVITSIFNLEICFS